MLGLMVKPTYKCNLNCKYCFSKQFDYKEDMDLFTVDRLANFVSRNRTDIKWTWHGGEPLMMPIEFYKESYNILNRYNIDQVSIQTNGTLLDRKKLEWFKKVGWDIGFSFDFTSQSKLRGKKDKVIESMKLFQEIYGRKTGAIKIIEGRSVKDFYKDYFMVKELGFGGITFNRVFDSKGAKTLEGFTEEYLDSLVKLLNIWFNDENPVRIKNLENRIKSLLGLGNGGCSYNGDCVGRWFGITPQGDVYPCERYLPEKYKYGSIYDFKNMDDLLNNSEVYDELLEISAERKNYCRNNCSLYDFCYGGCNVTAINNNGGRRPVESECSIFKKEMYHIFNKLKSLDVNNIKNSIIKRILIKNGYRGLSFIEDLERSKLDE